MCSNLKTCDSLQRFWLVFPFGLWTLQMSSKRYARRRNMRTELFDRQRGGRRQIRLSGAPAGLLAARFWCTSPLWAFVRIRSVPAPPCIYAPITLENLRRIRKVQHSFCCISSARRFLYICSTTVTSIMAHSRVVFNYKTRCSSSVSNKTLRAPGVRATHCSAVFK